MVYIALRYLTHEKVVILNPVRPNEAVHAGSRHDATFTTSMIAKQSQKDRPMLPPTIPVEIVATAMLALSLEESQSRKNDLDIEVHEGTHQKVHAFQT